MSEIDNLVDEIKNSSRFTVERVSSDTKGYKLVELSDSEWDAIEIEEKVEDGGFEVSYCEWEDYHQEYVPVDGIDGSFDTIVKEVIA